jgi:hypothetical protein
MPKDVLACEVLSRFAEHANRASSFRWIATPGAPWLRREPTTSVEPAWMLGSRIAPKRRFPNHKKMVPTVPVSGAPPEAKNAYDICQALSWLAKERRQVQDQLEAMQELPALMDALLRRREPARRNCSVPEGIPLRSGDGDLLQYTAVS